jgi:nucleotide-binding universal stress UspA family protein
MNILVPINFSKASFAAFYYATELAHEINANVICLNVVNVAYNFTGTLNSNLPGLSVEEMVTRDLNKFVESYPELDNITIKNVPLKYEVEFGIPGQAITDYAAANNIDLIVMGIKNKYNLIERSVSTLSSYIVDNSPCPLMLIHENTRFNTPSKIIFAYDEKGNLKNALNEFKKFNKQIKAKTDFVHVSKVLNENLEIPKEEIIETLFEKDEVPFSFEIKSITGTDIKSELQDYCLMEKADILTLIHHRGNFMDKLFGRSISINMARDYHLPVMIINSEPVLEKA